MAAKPELPVLDLPTREAWEEWLDENHASSDGVWLKMAKKGADGLARADALELALIYGWIDSQARSLDDSHWLQRFTPRKSRSKWSRVNRDAATRLIETGAMKPAGLREVERAKADGRWDAAYEPPTTAAIPDDLQAALDANPEARAFFEKLDSRNRYAILYRIADAKKPETRARRIEKFVATLANGEKLYP